MSDYVWEDAWVLLAVKFAQGLSLVITKKEVIKAGDYINHAIILDKEFEHARIVLSQLGLLKYENGIYSLGQNFEEFWSNIGAEKHRSVHKQLQLVENGLGTK